MKKTVIKKEDCSDCFYKDCCKVNPKKCIYLNPPKVEEEDEESE